jgi:hypothetical protein
MIPSDKFPTMSPAALASIAAQRPQQWPAPESTYFVTQVRQQQAARKAAPYGFGLSGMRMTGGDQS